MERGFTLNGQHSSVLGVIMATKGVPVLTASNDVYLQVPGRDGSYMVPRELADGAIVIECGISTANAIALMTAKRQIAAWVFSRQKVQLIFDDEPDKYYLVKYASEIGLSKMSSPGMGQFKLVFRCEPYAYFLTPKTQNFIVDAISINNLGTAPVFPKFAVTFTAPATEFKVWFGNYYVRVVRNFIIGDVLIIDNALSKVTVNGLNAMASLDLSSRFFGIGSGLNTLNVTPVAKANTAITWKERWL